MDVGRYHAKRGVAGVQGRPIETPTATDGTSRMYMDGVGGVVLSEIHSRNASESIGNRSSGLLYRPSTSTQQPPPQAHQSNAPSVGTTTSNQRGLIPERHHYLHVGDGVEDSHQPQRGTGLVFTPIQQRTATNHHTTTSPAATPINRAAGDRSTFSSMLHTSSMTKSHDEELCVILQYLKNYYGQEEDEGVRGLDSMTADDVLALAQCFYLDMFRLLRDKRLERGSPPRHHSTSNMSQSNDPYNSFVWGPTPQHVGVPIHEDLDIPVTDDRSGQEERVVPLDAQSSPRQVAPPSQRQVHVPPSPRVSEGQHPRDERVQPQSSRPSFSSDGLLPESAPKQQHTVLQNHDYVPPSPSNHTTPTSATTPRGSAQRLQTPTSRPVPPPSSVDTAAPSAAARPPPVVRVNPHPQSVVVMPAYEEDEGEEDLPQQRPSSVRADQNRHIMDARQAQQQQHRSESPFDPQEATARPPPRSVALVPLRTAMPLLQRGTYLIKFALHGGKPQRRFMFLKDLPMHLGGNKKGTVNVPHLCWSSQPAQAAKETLPLLHLLDVRIGSNDNFKKDRKSGRIMAPNSSGVVRESHCFTLIFDTRSVDLAAEQESDFQLWAGGMLAILKRNEELSAQ